MSDTPQDLSSFEPEAVSTDAEMAALLQSLRRKEGSWVEWGQACQTLQKSGYTAQAIFEATGFEPIQQNQIIVAAQVYASIVTVGISESTQAHFQRKGSDVLYELRILTQTERAAAAEFAFDQQLDLDEAKEVARAIKDFARLSKPPEDFSNHPGDAVAFQVWKNAKQKSDLQERSRLIAKGLRFVHSNPARKKIERLLTDFTVTPSRPAPRLPVYRLESDEELPRILPVVGKLPLTKADLQAVPLVEETGGFQLVHFSGTGAWVPLPGWQVIRAAEDPVVLLCDSDRLPLPSDEKVEEMVVVVDRAQRDWDESSYFVVAEDEQLQIRWFEAAPEVSLLGRVVLTMRPKQVLDVGYTKEMLTRQQRDDFERWVLEE
jgi:Rubisco Assembly chaperone C-terminal domain/Rubisco accumulation factor 1 alpha helical domain/Rubisco accumulation factor 1 helix turn helix domain